MESRQGSSVDSRDRELRLRIRVVLQETVKGRERKEAEIACEQRINEVKKWKSLTLNNSHKDQIKKLG